MSEFLYDWSDTSMGLDSPQHGIPIPRSQHSQPFTRPDFNNSQAYLYDNDSPSPRPILVPFNSLVMNGEGSNLSSYYEYPLENQRSALSPINFAGSPLPPPSKLELDTEIKMEPFDDLLNIGPVTNSQETLHPLQEDNLLDNVNFEDLLMADNMDSSQTPCLDPQHSSPAAMAAVHPDEVFGFIRPENSYQPVHISPSVSVPVKAENATFGAVATSFPPQGIGWKDQSPVPANYPQCQPLDNQLRHQQPAHQQLHRSFMKGSPQHPSRLLISMGKFSPQDPQTPASTYHNRFTNSPNSSSGNNNSSEDKPLYTQLESPASTTSALHDLLIGSPSTSLSPQQPHQLQNSPHSTGSNLSPASPFRGLSQDIPIGQSVPGAPTYLMARSSSLSSRLSSSAPVNEFSFDQIWQRREPRQHLLSTGSLAEEVGGSTSSLSTGGGILSPLSHDLSIDEGIDSDDDSDGDHYDSDSDNESIMSEEISLGGTGTKRERHFWQYNVQAKGPKGQRVNIMQRENDPHQLAKIMDPVFSPLCSIQGIKHSGKARRGDGNDLTPSPRKLVSIGIELSKLNKKINEMTPVSELPSTIRSKSRKEKNKLASRACRLKKKAQHEANKIKLYGLEQEHHGLLSLISKTKEELLKKVELVRNPNAVDLYQQLDSSPRDSFCGLGSPGTTGRSSSSSTSTSTSSAQLQQMLSSRIESTSELRKQRIAGLTTEFVNKVIENCRNGNPSGGLDELAQTFAKASLFSFDGVNHSHVSNEPQL